MIDGWPPLLLQEQVREGLEGKSMFCSHVKSPSFSGGAALSPLQILLQQVLWLSNTRAQGTAPQKWGHPGQAGDRVRKAGVGWLELWVSVCWVGRSLRM